MAKQCQDCIHVLRDDTGCSPHDSRLATWFCARYPKWIQVSNHYHFCGEYAARTPFKEPNIKKG